MQAVQTSDQGATDKAFAIGNVRMPLPAGPCMANIQYVCSTLLPEVHPLVALLSRLLVAVSAAASQS